MTREDKRKLCRGCHDEIYHNWHGCNECWSFADAKVVSKKMVHINDVPPWKHKPIKTLSCYHRPQYVMVDAKQTC
jgi:hypothetical protein